MASLEALQELFTLACSQQHEIARAADVQLGVLSSQSGFYSAVTRVAVDRNVDLHVRLQATLFLKNAIDTVWRKNRGGKDASVLLDEEKQAIRSLLLSAYNDESRQISLHLAIVISKIARFDCPQNWPDLIPQLASTIDGSVARADSLSHQRALFILYYVVKTLASKRLAGDKRIFQELCAKVFVPVVGYWKAHLSQAGFSEVSSSSAVLCLKTLRYMVVYGFSDASANESANEFLQSLSSSAKTVVELVETATGEIRENLQKIVRVTLKLACEFAEHSPLEFVHWLSSFLELAGFCAFGLHSSVLVLPKLAQVRAINLMKLVLLCQVYRVQSKDRSDPSTVDACAEAIRICDLFFTADAVPGFCQALVERYLVLSQEELDIWQCEPEVYATTENVEAWRHMLRPAAESFFVALVHEFWEVVAPLARRWLEMAGMPLNIQITEHVLIRDAVLAAIGLAANDLYEEVDFGAFFTNVCLPVMTTPAASEAQRIILRRVIWLCGKWIDVKFSKEAKPRFYEAAIGLIGKADEDLVIRLTACDSLKRALDEYEFELETFRPYLNAAVCALIGLLRCCHESDSQMHVITTIWLLAERAGRELAGNIDAIVTYVPVLWQSDNCMLKGQILNLFTQLVKGLGSECHVLMDGLCVMLSKALDTNDPDHVYLLEEGLDLWLSLVENSRSPLAPQLLSLFRFMAQLLTVQSENLRICCDVIKAYCFYRDAGFANAYLSDLGKVFRSIIVEMRSEGISSVVKVLETIIRCFTKDALAPMSDIIGWCIETLAATQETVSVKQICTAVVSLVSVQNIQQLYGVMASAMNEEQITDFLKKWLELVGLMSHDLERRKSNGLGLCTWLTLPIKSIDVLFPCIVSTLVDILADVCVDENGSYVDSLTTYDFGLCSGGDDNSSFPETEHDRRCQRLRDVDPIYNSSLQTHVIKALDSRKQLYGAEAFENLWKSVDDDVAHSLKKLCAV